MFTIAKHPSAKLIYGLNWEKANGSSKTISDHQWTVPSGLTLTRQWATDTQGLVELSGGTLSTTYEVVGQMTNTEGEIDYRTIKILIMNR